MAFQFSSKETQNAAKDFPKLLSFLLLIHQAGIALICAIKSHQDTLTFGCKSFSVVECESLKISL